MALPINIEQLLHGRVVETERLEFKEGWNPQAVLHTMCAFANDVNNWGGGYTVIGIAEKKAVWEFTPKGLTASEIGKIQKELLGLSHKIKPEYFPIVEVTKYKGKDIVIIWVPGGSRRPYKAAVTLGKGAQYAYYIRRNDTTKRATATDERGLMKLANDIPFDDRVNHKATIEDLNAHLIEAFLYAVKSDLLKEVPDMTLENLCRRMNIVEGPSEHLKPKNVGLMLFSNDPQKYFPVAQIDVVQYKDEVGDDFDEKIFTGPVHEQLRAALKYIKDLVIVEYVHKVDGRAEADRFFNYPYGAIEEAVVNAVYHRSYEEREPVVVRIYPDKILVISYPGPVPPLGKANINKPIISTPRYRNRRLGDFLKELELTEGRCTGFPKIRRALKNNGSPAPVFETDNDREYFMTTLKINPRAQEMAKIITPMGGGKVIEIDSENRVVETGEKTRVETRVETRVKTGEKILQIMKENPAVTIPEIAKFTGLTVKGVEWNLKALKKKELLRRVGSTKGGHWEIVPKSTPEQPV
ncbi:MAG: putative DNA binding domain-containing protein [Candidatus Omnitrophica bacterium]|nr:putative DNA binding domain-containing protein [Candidatus Omnitrophota bacterium]